MLIIITVVIVLQYLPHCLDGGGVDILSSPRVYIMQTLGTERVCGDITFIINISGIDILGSDK